MRTRLALPAVFQELVQRAEQGRGQDADEQGGEQEAQCRIGSIHHTSWPKAAVEACAKSSRVACQAVQVRTWPEDAIVGFAVTLERRFE
jgi:hypothetical protein